MIRNEKRITGAGPPACRANGYACNKHQQQHCRDHTRDAHPGKSPASLVPWQRGQQQRLRNPFYAAHLGWSLPCLLDFAPGGLLRTGDGYKRRTTRRLRVIPADLRAQHVRISRIRRQAQFTLPVTQDASRTRRFDDIPVQICVQSKGIQRLPLCRGMRRHPG